jgi:hypothetical protein
MRRTGEPAESIDTAVATIRKRLAELNQEAQRHRDETDYDPMWRNGRATVLAVGATVASALALIEPDADLRGAAYFNSSSGPIRVRARPGSELWSNLTDYLTAEIEHPKEQAQSTAACAFLYLVAEAMLMIDDTEPPWDG